MTRTDCIVCGTPLPPPSGRGGPPRKYCSERCRKSQYGQPCIDCGIRTTHGAERKRVPEPRCLPCAHRHSTVWTSEKIIERLRAWATLYGEPPAIADWNTYQARHELHDETRAARFEAGHWPCKTTVIGVFGSWNAAIAAAGFTPRRSGGFSENQAHRRAQRREATAA